MAITRRRRIPQSYDDAVRKERNVVRTAITRALGRVQRAAVRGQVDVEAFDELTAVLQRSIARTNTLVHLIGSRDAMSRVPRRLVLSDSDDLRVLKDTLRRQLGMDFDALEAKYTSDAFRVARGVTGSVERRVREVLNEAIREQLRPSEAADRLREAFVKEGVAAQSQHSLEAVYNTQASIAYQAGKWSTYRTPLMDEILWGFRYVSVGDARVRPAHVLLDGTTLPKDDPFWQRYWPPNGWNCRCDAIPVFSNPGIKLPDREVEPDRGFEWNPGEVFRESPSAQRVNEWVIETNTPVRKARTTAEKPLTPQQEAVVATVPRAPAPVEMREEDAKVLDQAISRSRVTKRVVTQTVTRDSLLRTLPNGLIQLVKHHVAAARRDSIQPTEPGLKLRLFIQLRAGDVALPIGDARVILPRGAILREIRRVRRPDGFLDITLTPVS